LRFVVNNVLVLNGGTLEPGTYRVEIERKGGVTSLRVNGEVKGSTNTGAAWRWAPTAALGSSRLSEALQINGSIRDLRIRSYEEVSP